MEQTLLATLLAVICVVAIVLWFLDYLSVEIPPPFDGRTPDPRAEGWLFVVDGSNMSYSPRLPNNPSLTCLDAVITALEKRFPGADFHIFCDANLRYQLSPEDGAELVSRVRSRRGTPYVETHGKSADEVLLGFAKSRSRVIVVSNDNFNKSDEELALRAGVPVLKISMKSWPPRPWFKVQITDSRGTVKRQSVSSLIRDMR